MIGAMGAATQYAPREGQREPRGRADPDPDPDPDPGMVTDFEVDYDSGE